MKKSLINTLLLVLVTLGTASAQTITTFAGLNKHAFYNPTAATVAQVFMPQGVFVTRSGLLYFADGYNNAVRMLNTATGTLTTIAGNGAQGFGGDGGPATAAQLFVPADVAADTAGNVYIVDAGNNRIRKVSASGIISTIAGIGTPGYIGDGAAATLAQLNSPQGIAIDRTGNLYIADESNACIRKISTSGIITTFAGTGVAGYGGDGSAATLAQMASPTGLRVDTSGNLYIAENANYCIRKVNTAGIISTIAGTGVAGFTGDGSAATSAKLNYPTYLAVDRQGNIYISDTYNDRIRKVSTSGIITTVIGNGSVGFGGDGGAATSAILDQPFGIDVDSSGNIFFADANNNRIRKVNTSAVINSVIGNNGYAGDGGAATAALMQMPMAVCKDNSGNIYIADSANHTVRKVNAAGVISTVAGTGVSGNSGDGDAATSATLGQPVSVAVNSTGDIFIADMIFNVVRKVNGATGTITTFAGNGTAGYTGNGSVATLAELHSPWGLALDAAGNLYISDNGNNAIRKVDATSNIISLYAGSNVAGFSGDSGPATAAKVSSPAYIAFDALNNLFIADMNNNRLRKVDGSTGNIATVFGNGTAGSAGDGGMGTSAELCSPMGVAVDDSGGISTTVCGKIRHVPPTGGPVTVDAGTGAVGMTPDGTAPSATIFNGLAGICFSGNGSLLVADAINRCVRGKIIPSTGITAVESVNSHLEIFPNPNNGVFELTGFIERDQADDNIVVTIIDVLGREVYKARAAVVDRKIRLPVAMNRQISDGVFYCRVSGSTFQQTISFVLAQQ